MRLLRVRNVETILYSPATEPPARGVVSRYLPTTQVHAQERAGSVSDCSTWRAVPKRRFFLRFFDLARAQAARADVGAAGDSAHQNPHLLQVRVEAPPGGDHRVAAVVSESRTLAAD